MQRLLGTTRLAPRQWGLALVSALVLLGLWEAAKAIARTRHRGVPTATGAIAAGAPALAVETGVLSPAEAAAPAKD
jgi:hypothetical protein